MRTRKTRPRLSPIVSAGTDPDTGKTVYVHENGKSFRPKFQPAAFIGREERRLKRKKDKEKKAKKAKAKKNATSKVPSNESGRVDDRTPNAPSIE